MLHYFEFRRQPCLPKKCRLVDLHPKHEREKHHRDQKRMNKVKQDWNLIESEMLKLALLNLLNDEKKRLKTDRLRNAQVRNSGTVQRM